MPRLDTMPDAATDFEVKIASLQPRQTKGAWPRLESFLLTVFWWFSCCCCFRRQKPFGLTKQSKKEDWSAHRKDRLCPAQLKVSTIDERTIEVKITYAENAAMSTQLYEVDVFMFFLKDLEAVSTNFYSDLWQSTRMHTPKIPLAAMADGEASDSLSNMIKEHLLVIQYKRLVGNEHDAAVQQDIDQAIDTVVQQLRLQGCMFRQSVRQAMKAITIELERMQCSRVMVSDTQRVAAQIGRVTQLIAEVMQKVHTLCHPLESSEAPEAVREVWVMVDEYMLTEAEISFIKLLETLDKTAQLYSSAVASDQSEHCQRVGGFAAADTDGISFVAQEDSSSKRSADAVSSSSSSSSSSASLLEENYGTRQSDSITSVAACSTELEFHLQNHNVTASSFYEQEGCHHAATTSQPSAQAECRGVDRPWGLGEGQCQDLSAKPSESATEPSSNPRTHRPLPLHSSASSHVPAPLHMHSSASDAPANKQSSNENSSTTLASCDATEASAAKSTGEGASRWDSDPQRRAAACTLLYDPRVHKATLQDRDSPGLDTSVDCASEPCDDQREAGISNMQILIMRAKELQRSGSEHCSVGVGAQHAADAHNKILQALADARQLIVDAAEHLQAEMRSRGYFESMIHDDDSDHNEVYTNRIKCLKHNARAAVVLQHQTLQQSFLLADVVGATIAGLAMCLAIGGIYLCYRFSRYQLNPLYVLITVVAYMMKDRMKEWGKRYLQPVCVKFGFEFPDRIVKVRDSRGRRVGRCKEWAKVVGDDQVDARVLAMRHKDQSYVPKVQQATKPERVMTYRKKMEVNWDRLDPRLQCVDGLDDIMRFDLQHFCRRMQPPQEPHYRMSTDFRGRKYAEQVQCARVYHINVVLRIRTSTQDKVRNRAYREKSMQIQRARVVMDQDGIKRLEATDESVHLKSDRRALHRLSTPDWLADVHMPSMQLPKMPQMNFSGFGRRLAENKSKHGQHEEAV